MQHAANCSWLVALFWKLNLVFFSMWRISWKVIDKTVNMVASREGGRDLNVGSFLLIHTFLIPEYFSQNKNWFSNPESPMEWGKAHETLPVAEDLLAIDGCWWTECIFLRDVFLQRLPMLQQVVLHPCP